MSRKVNAKRLAMAVELMAEYIAEERAKGGYSTRNAERNGLVFLVGAMSNENAHLADKLRAALEVTA